MPSLTHIPPLLAESAIQLGFLIAVAEVMFIAGMFGCRKLFRS